MCERYSPNPADGAEVSMPSFSLAKSLTSAVAGTLVQRGKLDVHAPVAAPDWATPGSTFNYNTGGACILARAMATALGGPAQFTRFVETEPFDKLGMAVTLTYDDQGTWLGGFAASASTVDYAKLGLLYLRDGVWAGERLLPPGHERSLRGESSNTSPPPRDEATATWVDYSRTPTPANHDYGAGWWLDAGRPGVFSARGAHGQVLTVDPAHDLTFVVTSSDGDSGAVSAAILDAFGR